MDIESKQRSEPKGGGGARSMPTEDGERCRVAAAAHVRRACVVLRRSGRSAALRLPLSRRARAI